MSACLGLESLAIEIWPLIAYNIAANDRLKEQGHLLVAKDRLVKKQGGFLGSLDGRFLELAETLSGNVVQKVVYVPLTTDRCDILKTSIVLDHLDTGDDPFLGPLATSDT
jgi:hypothetical protein